ncbi:hypothetical protein WJX84_003485 [Apatococcus fuscideae]|uniref:Sulfotransferase n=1 Tax=Apatococcus fuscideae TaxID=2026836 RepID=A0AAW1SMU6_9CHLO
MRQRGLPWSGLALQKFSVCLLLFATTLVNASLHLRNFTEADILRCQKGATEPPPAQRLTITGLPFSGSVLLQELMAELLKLSCTSKPFKGHCTIPKVCAAKDSPVACVNYHESGPVGSYAMSNEHLSPGWLSTGPGWPFNYNSRKFVEDCLSIGFPVASLDCKLVPSSRVVEFDSTTQLVLKLHVWPERDEKQQAQDQDFQHLYSSKVKYVHVLRDPRETVLLWANNKTMIDGSAKHSMEETTFKPLTYRAALVQDQFRDAVGWMVWWHYWYATLQARNEQDVLLVHHANLIANPFKELGRVATYLGLCTDDALLKKVAALVPKGAAAAGKSSRKGKEAEEPDEGTQYKQFLHELPPKMSLMMNRSIYEVMPKHLSQLYLGNRVPKPMPENEDLWEVKPGQATGFKP